MSDFEETADDPIQLDDTVAMAEAPGVSFLDPPADELPPGTAEGPGPEVEASWLVDQAAPDLVLPDADPTAAQDRLAVDAIAALGESLGGKLDRLQAQFEREGRAESSREKVLDRLHAELQDYKNDLLLKVMKPVFVDLIQLHDDIGKIVDAQDAEGESARLLDLMRGFQQGIEDILYRQGVEPFRVEGDEFDPRRQRAVTTVPTDEADHNRRVAARLRLGFTAGEKVIRPEVVSVFSSRRPPP